MPQVPDAVIGDAYRSDFAWDLLETLTDLGGRLPGHEGEKAGARAVASALESTGMRAVTTTEFTIPGWWRGSSALSVKPAGGRCRTLDADHEVVGLPGTPAGTVETDLVDLEAGLPEDFAHGDVAGNIVMVGSQNPPGFGRAINRIEKYARAVEAGAVGFVYANADTAGCIPPTGTVGFCNEFPAAVPAVGVSREVHERLRRSLDAGDVTVTLDVAASAGEATSRNVEAVVGPTDGPELLVTGHVDAHDIADGARDNGAGTVLAAEVGRLLGQMADDLGARVRVVAFGGEETGLFGSTHWADTNDLAAVAGQVNLDGIGYARDLGVSGLGLLGPFRELGEGVHGDVKTTAAASPFNDHWPFVTRGVPSVTCSSTAGGEGQVVRYGTYEWGHTHADTLDKLDPRDLRDLAIAIATAVVTATDRVDEIGRVPADRARSHLSDGLAEYLQFDDRWPW